ncbi:MAG: hypothetical protein KDA37_03205 [Planctomycetales bacterium]|nr:hypothetical protein [Planctomycetales bacterium]
MSALGLYARADEIHDDRTREYFDELMRCYSASSYRATTVLLWSFVVADLLFKLADAAGVHDDATAEAILKEATARQAAHPRSGDWELQLVEAIHARTELLDDAEFQHLVTLQKYRHLCAHPVVSSGGVLYQPSRETSSACIEQALSAVFVKPPLLTRGVFDHLLIDLEAKSELLPDVASVARYLGAKYLPYMGPDARRRVLRGLWKLVTRPPDDKCRANLAVNYRALRAVIDHSPLEALEQVRGEPVYFGNVQAEGAPWDLLIELLQYGAPLYAALPESVHTLVENYAATGLDAYAACVCLSGSVPQHLMAVVKELQEPERFVRPPDPWDLTWAKRKFTPSRFEQLVRCARDTGALPTAIDLGIALYATSTSFDEADVRFRTCVLPLLTLYSREQLASLLRGIEGNRETYDRRRAPGDHRLVAATVERELGAAPTSDEHPNFVTSLGT